jgi:hypothetical protein
MDVLAWWLKLVGRIVNRSRDDDRVNQLPDESPAAFSGTPGRTGAALR